MLELAGFGWMYDDGGRHAAGFRGNTGDCVVRSIAIATGFAYRDVYDDLHDRQRAFVARKRPKNGRTRSASPRFGVAMDVAKPYLAEHGWEWVPTMSIGLGTTVHLRPGELPDHGPLIVRVTGHVTAIVDGLVRDTHDPCRGGMRAVYGYWQPGNSVAPMRTMGS
jgi:hypothetical protein